MSVKSKRCLSLLLALLLLTVLSFSSCTAFMDTLAKDEIEACSTFFDHVRRNSYAAAYDSVKNFTTPEVFESFWDEARAALAGAKSFTLSAKEWSSFTDNGHRYTDALLLLTTDTGASTLVYAVLWDGEWLCGMQVVDVTDFVAGTSWVPTTHLTLTIISLLGFAFSLWMFIDALKRRIKWKVLWAILVLVSLGGGFTIGAATARVAVNFSLFYPYSAAAIDYTSLAVSVRAMLPVGALVYFFLRRRLPLKETPTPVTPVGMPTATPVVAPTETPAATTEPPADIAPAATPAETIPAETTPAETTPATAEPPASEETKGE